MRPPGRLAATEPSCIAARETAGPTSHGFIVLMAVEPSDLAWSHNALGRLGAPDDVRVVWLGTAGFAIEYRGSVVLIDPYVTRASLGSLLVSVRPDREAIARHVPRADAIIVGHTHFDHALDVPEIARRTGAIVFGSRSAAALCRAGGVPADRVDVVERDSGSAAVEREVGPFAMRFIPSAHSRFLLGRVPAVGDIADCDDVPARASEIPVRRCLRDRDPRRRPHALPHRERRARRRERACWPHRSRAHVRCRLDVEPRLSRARAASTRARCRAPFALGQLPPSHPRARANAPRDADASSGRPARVCIERGQDRDASDPGTRPAVTPRDGCGCGIVGEPHRRRRRSILEASGARLRRSCRDCADRPLALGACGRHGVSARHHQRQRRRPSWRASATDPGGHRRRGGQTEDRPSHSAGRTRTGTRGPRGEGAGAAGAAAAASKRRRLGAARKARQFAPTSVKPRQPGCDRSQRVRLVIARPRARVSARDPESRDPFP